MAQWMLNPEAPRLMAQMIAQARTPQAPGQPRRSVIGGGGAGPIMSKSANVEAKVSLGPIMRLFGYKTDEEKRKLGQQFVDAMEGYSDEDRERILGEESTQTILGGALKAGVPGVIEQTGLYGTRRYNVARQTPEAMVKGLSGEQIIARGGPPAERLTQYQKETRQKTETEILAGGGPEAETLLRNKETQTRQAALASETPMHKRVLESQADQFVGAAEAHRASAKKDLEITKYIPEEQTRQTQESKAKIISLNAEAKRNSAQGDYFLSESKAKKEEGKTENIILKGSIDAYRTTQNAWINAYAKAGVGEERTNLMGIMTSATERYITSMNTLKRPELGNDALSFWLSSTNDELSSTLVPTTGRLPTKGYGILAPKVAQPKQDMLFQQRASQVVGFMQSMGSSIDDRTAYKSLDLFTRIYSQTTHTPSMNSYAQLMVEVGKALGYPMTTLQNFISGPPKAEPLEKFSEEQLKLP